MYVVIVTWEITMVGVLRLKKEFFHIYKKMVLRNRKEIQRGFFPSKFINQQWPGQKGRAIYISNYSVT